MTGHLDDDRLRAFGRPARVTVWPAGDALLCVGDAETLLRIVARDGAFAVDKQDRGGAWYPQMTSGSLDVARRYLLWEIGDWVQAAAGRRPGHPVPTGPLREGFALIDLGDAGLELRWHESGGQRSARFPHGRWRTTASRFARYADASEASIVERFAPRPGS